MRKRSIRPLFLLLLAIGFWIATLPALLAPENITQVTYPSYNVIESNTTASLTLTFPVQTVQTVSKFQQGSYNSYFYVWLVILTFLFFMLLIWYLNLLQRKAGEVLKQGRDVMEQLDRRNK